MNMDIETLGESALLLRLGDGMDAPTNARVHALARSIRESNLEGLDDIVPAYASILVRHRHSTAAATQALSRRIRELANHLGDEAIAADAREHHIPICYGDTCGADLDELARACNMTPDEVVKRHAAPEYRVAMTGFAPGFPYLIGMDRALATPRRDTPRTRVPAGSVGIAGPQTGIYPGELPGGWQLIGRTPLRLFDADRSEHPCLLEPGDRVRFDIIDTTRFERWESSC